MHWWYSNKYKRAYILTIDRRWTSEQIKKRKMIAYCDNAVKEIKSVVRKTGSGYFRRFLTSVWEKNTKNHKIYISLWAVVVWSWSTYLSFGQSLIPPRRGRLHWWLVNSSSSNCSRKNPRPALRLSSLILSKLHSWQKTGAAGPGEAEGRNLRKHCSCLCLLNSSRGLLLSSQPPVKAPSLSSAESEKEKNSLLTTKFLRKGSGKGILWTKSPHLTLVSLTIILENFPSWKALSVSKQTS